VTATHLKRLFASQDVFNSLDRNVAGMTVSEADEKETNAGESGPSSTETPTPTEEHPPSLALQCDDAQSIQSPDDGVTPIAGICSPVKNPMSQSHSPEHEYDSDSTISAHPRQNLSSSIQLLRPPVGDTVESSGMDSDAQGFVSRLPRRSRPTPR